MCFAAQVLPQLVLPIGLTLLLALAGLALRRRWLVLLALALLWVASSDLTARALWRVVEAGQERTLAADAPPADAVVVLSGRRRTAPGDAGVRGRDTAEPFLAGLELMRAERAPRLFFTGGWSPWTPEAAPEGDVNRLDALALVDLFPSGRALAETETALRELLGRAVYRVGR